MSQNEFSFKPTLEIDKSKDIQSLKSIVTDINKIGKNSTINITQNQDISDREKVLSLWEENNYLHGIINQIEIKLIELENNQDIYHTYRVVGYDNDEIFYEFLSQLTKNKIKYIKLIDSYVKPGGGQFPGSINHTDKYKVLDKDNELFLDIIKKYNIIIFLKHLNWCFFYYI